MHDSQFTIKQPRIVHRALCIVNRASVLALCIVLFSCHSSSKKQETQHPPSYSSLSDSTHYVGINTCKQCHQDKYETFIHTGMGLSFDSATHQKTSAKFDAHALVYDKYKDFYYKPFWTGDSLYLKEFRLKGKDTVYQRVERINYIVGSGQHTNSHETNVNGYIYQVPATFYTQRGHWDLPPGFEGGFNSRFSRKIELECMSCHNGYPKIVLGSDNKYESLPNGIDCERCHGPGSEHVKQKQAGQLVDISKEIDYSIVNPAKLSINLQLDVCQRCHVQGNAVLKEGKSFYDFRPGMQLSSVMDVYMPVFKGDESSHIMASHAERLKQSQCFIHSASPTPPKEGLSNANSSSGSVGGKSPLWGAGGALTCVTCHNPHISVRLTEHTVFNDACKNCHYDDHTKTALSNEVAKSNLLCTENEKKRLDVGDDCVKCHMPKNGTIDIPHVTTTDHYIRKPVKEADVKKIKEFIGLACINNPNADAESKGKAFLNYYEKFVPNPSYLDSAKKYFNDQTDEDVKKNFKNLIRWAFLNNDYRQIISYASKVHDVFSILSTQNYSNDDAWASYRIGEAYYALENKDLGINFFMNAVKLAPYQLEFRNKLAQSQFDIGRTEDARKNLEFIIKENPKYPSAYISLGYLVLSVDHDIQRADSYYDKALALDPDNEQALFNKAGTLLYLEKKKEAVLILQRLLKKNPKHGNARELLKSLNSKV